MTNIKISDERLRQLAKQIAKGIKERDAAEFEQAKTWHVPGRD
jgi:hypothetical protein|tara:strand:- start:475 stop:603 length:129 start_codon:yes stop_codon:yes gene_type:complete